MNTVFLQIGGGSDSMLPTFAMVGAMIVAFYFLMLRPQMTKQKQEKSFQESLKVGRRVVTTAGIHGRIAQIQEDGFILETLSGKLKFEKAAISREFTMARFPENAEEKK